MAPLKACYDCGRLSPRTRCDRCRRPNRPAAPPAGGPRSYRGTAAWRRMRLVVWARDNGVCARCGETVAAGERWDLGHVVAHADGGAFEADNLRVEHASCNRGA